MSIFLMQRNLCLQSYMGQLPLDLGTFFRRRKILCFDSSLGQSWLKAFRSYNYQHSLKEKSY